MRAERPARPDKSLFDTDAKLHRTLPEGEEHYGPRLFGLARESRARWPDATPDELRPFVLEWYSRSRPNLGKITWDDVWTGFLAAWENVDCPAGCGPLDKIVAKARSAATPAWAIARRYGEKMQHLVRLVRELQNENPNGPFRITMELVGDIIGTSSGTAGSYLGALVREGVLEVVAKGRRGFATRYRYFDPDEYVGI